jgi:membrane-bound metal-dependent hydrolase YbcI (DUF457 family)
MIIFGHKVHLVIAAGFYFYINNPKVSLIFILIGSILPDCDIFGAPAGWFLPLWIFRWKGRPIFNHRGIIHTIPAALFFGLITTKFFGVANGVSLFIGYISHLFMDAFTPMGICWWKGKKYVPYYAFKNKRKCRGL